MRFIPENEFKRGDALIHDKEYIVTYIYMDKDKKMTKTAQLKIFSVLDGMESELTTWFHDRYSHYEIIRINN
jgi:hypothetical protein